ncbi:MAG: DUF4435 domain-containing protein [Bacteroidaceae bacterium]|nr:DUF4435 domain-containing protein [Bacteroidaceae bacterium]
MKNESFELSIPAQNVEAKFYGRQTIVYVEGGDDILFWYQYFDKRFFLIREKGGGKNLVDYENDIIHKGLKCVVAKDSDYSSFTGRENMHPLIVYTYSHSIECMMYCPHNLNSYLNRLTRSVGDYTNEIEQLYNTFCEDIEELLILDIASGLRTENRQKICGDSCVRFLKTNTSIHVSKEKVDTFKESVIPLFDEIEISNAHELLKKDERCIRQVLKGHFQTGFVINLLKYLTKRIRRIEPSISNDALYSQLVTSCSERCSMDCYERNFIINQINNAIDYLS